jgi:CMP-N-acetylneuraminic acid synthetase
MIKRIAIIPARGGSKRIPRKNIREFAGKPMISYVLDTTQRSDLFDKIHVSTEDSEIIELVESNGLKIDFRRPLFLSDDRTPIMPVKYVLKKYQSVGELYDEVWLLMACNPLIEPADLISASKKFENNCSIAPVLAVTEYPVPIE